MKVTKYPQSCLLLEDGENRMLIDPGSFVAEKYKAGDFGSLKGILITHRHADHADEDLLRELSGGTLPIIANQDSKEALGDLVTQVVSDGESFELAGFKITARELPHVAMPDGSPGPQNTGYVINDAFFHPGDGIEISSLQVETAAAPIAGPDISVRDVFDFIKSVGAQRVIPIHYDFFKQDPHFIAVMSESMNLPVQFIVLENGQSNTI